MKINYKNLWLKIGAEVAKTYRVYTCTKEKVHVLTVLGNVNEREKHTALGTTVLIISQNYIWSTFASIEINYSGLWQGDNYGFWKKIIWTNNQFILNRKCWFLGNASEAAIYFSWNGRWK